jgi:D-glycero-D-manno-heptose 1,7-bisphosphate phosphatase
VGKRSLITGKNACVFLDRDGVLNEPVIRNGRPYSPSSASELKICRDALTACAKLKAAGFLLVVITNQPDVGRGKIEQSVAEEINRRLAAAIPVLDRIETCMHAGERYGERCDCRKPKPGMLLRAAQALQLDLRRSFVIGDRWRDIGCARAAGCRAIFIDRCYAEPLLEKPDVTVASFTEAVNQVLALTERERLLPIATIG